MRNSRKQKWGQVSAFLLCAALPLNWAESLAATEFAGGSLTGPILRLQTSGKYLFILATLVTFLYLRIGAAIGIASTLLCLPLYLYFVAPGPFRHVFKGEYSVPLHANFVWDNWAVMGMLTLAAAVYVSTRAFFSSQSGAASRNQPYNGSNSSQNPRVVV
jgi:hypothetical protein